MDQPLGYKIGNWLEIEECLDCLKGKGPKDLEEITIELTSEMLIQAGFKINMEDARKTCFQALRDGSAFNKFLELVRAQGGDAKFLQHPERFLRARYIKKIRATRDGTLSYFDTYQIGLGGIQLGSGRLNADTKIDPYAGIILHKKIGDPVKKGEILLELHSSRRSSLKAAEEQLKEVFIIQPKVINPPKLILSRLD